MLPLSLCALLWQGDLGEQRVVLVTKDLVLVPRGTSIEAHAVPGGRSAWTHRVEERHGPLSVPCRIQGAHIIGRAPLRLPGLAAGSITAGLGPAGPGADRSGAASPGAAGARRRPPAPYAVVLAGQNEVRGVSLRDGTLLWAAPKEDGCILSLHGVGDVDGDGVDDVVACGCNLAEGYGGRSGGPLWQHPVSGRALWAGPCGDLDGDGLGEVLLQAGTDLRVIATRIAGGAETLFRLDGFLPLESLPGNRSFLVVFAGASASVWGADGKGRRVWESRARILGAFDCEGRRAIAARDGLWIEGRDGARRDGAGPDAAGRDAPWTRVDSGEIAAAVATRTAVLVAEAGGALVEVRPGDGARRALGPLPPSPEGIAADPDGTIVAVRWGPRYGVWRIDGIDGKGEDREGRGPPEDGGRGARGNPEDGRVDGNEEARGERRPPEDEGGIPCGP